MIRDFINECVDCQIDDFKHPKTNKRSLCYRINYRSMDRNVTNDEINEIQEKVRSVVQDEFNVKLRQIYIHYKTRL